MKLEEFKAPEPVTSLPIRRSTVEDLVKHRNRALELYASAHTVLSQGWDVLQAAIKEHHTASPGKTRYNYHQDAEKRSFGKVLDLPPREQFLAKSQRLVDTDCWSHVVQLTDLQRLMDRKAKDELQRQLVDNPVEFTAENVFATLEQFMAEADMIWKRGIAECFSNLDRRFRSHDGWRIGTRIILDRVFGESGYWSSYGREAATLLDVERVFLMLDGGKLAPAYGHIVDVIDRHRGHGWGARQTFLENEYYKICIYKNGNVHLWFRREDLVRKVNRLLGEYYGAPIPEDREPDDTEDTLFTPKTTLAKNYGFFPTPPEAAEFVMDGVPLYRSKDEQPLRILEPSAGTGNLARLALCLPKPEKYAGRARDEIATDPNLVDCIEVQPKLADKLRASDLFRKVTCCDFLAIQPDPNWLYDRVLMNPPFDRERDIDHVLHALKFLKPGGFLMAIMSAGTEFRETRKSIAFRDIMKKMNAHWLDLPPASFASVGTYCNATRLTVYADGRSFYR